MAEVIVRTPGKAEDYVLIPACCYAGNQFEVSAQEYPPMYTEEEARPDMPALITDVPRLNPDGSGKIEVTAGDASVPCAGVFSPEEKRGILVFTVQEIGGKNVGIACEKGRICLTWPARREKIYGNCHLHDNPEPWEDLPGEIPHRILDFPCENLAEFYRKFFENRKIMGMDAARPAVLPPEKQFSIQREKFNRMNWYESLGIYGVGTNGQHFQVWQPGWVGGGMSGYPLMKLGGELEQKRALSTLDFLFRTQTEAGLFAGIVDEDGSIWGDGFCKEQGDPVHLIRKSADVLYFLFKYFDLMQERGMEIPQRYRDGAKKTADGFVNIWETAGQFGQFVNVNTGAVIAGGSAAGAIAPAGLVRAYQFFGNPAYLRTAEESAEQYYRDFLCKGYTTGGPGEILQGVDSESGFGLLESYVMLYEVTCEKKWLRYAEECACYCSSWVVPYNYRFPETSEFGRAGKKTVGTVFANIQNKHSAPGICTLSGDSLYRLWTWTKDPLYLELITDIARSIGQYLSTEEAPIYDWDVPPEERTGPHLDRYAEHRLPNGFICERVNMSDWETPAHVGGVFNGSCWPETSALLTLAELPQLLQTESV